MIVFYSLFFEETSDRRKDMANYRLKGEKVTVHGDGKIFVDGSKTNIKKSQHSCWDFTFSTFLKSKERWLTPPLLILVLDSVS